MIDPELLDLDSDIEPFDLAELLVRAQAELGISRTEFALRARCNAKSLQEWQEGKCLDSHAAFLRALLLTWRLTPRRRRRRKTRTH